MGTHETHRIDIVQAVVKHRRMIHAYANAVVRDFHLAEDIYQEVALIVAKDWDAIPPGSEMIPWLKEVTRRKALEALRKHRKMPIVLSEEVLELIAGQFTPSKPEAERAERNEQRYKIMERCLGKLRGIARVVINKRYGEERQRPCEEIAASLGRSVKAVYNIIGRARLALAGCVERESLRYSSGGGR